MPDEQINKPVAEQPKKPEPKAEDKAFHGPLKTGSAYIPSSFSNVTLVKIGTTQIGGVSDMKITKNYKRTKPMSNDVYTGPIASHVVDASYTWSFQTEDVATIALITAASFTLSFVWVASQNQLTGATLTANQTVTLTNCVMESPEYSANTKDVGKITVRGSTLGTADNSDPLTMAAAS